MSPSHFRILHSPFPRLGIRHSRVLYTLFSTVLIEHMGVLDNLVGLNIQHYNLLSRLFGT